jgi:hypothetical protein
MVSKFHMELELRKAGLKPMRKGVLHEFDFLWNFSVDNVYKYFQSLYISFILRYNINADSMIYCHLQNFELQKIISLYRM